MVDSVADQTGIDTLLAVARAGAAAHLNLLPIPAAVIEALPDPVVTASNGAYLRAGLLGDDHQPGLAAVLNSRLTSFLQSKALTTSFPWQAGSQVEARQYSVTLARRESDYPGCLVALVDRTAEMRATQTARREMLTDSLTGLLNRTGFGDRIEQILETDRADPSHYAVLVVDLDRFNRVNGCLGGLAGDELLITVARRIKSALRGHDWLARTGGDEFGILLTVEEPEADARRVAERVQGALAAPFRLSDYEIKIDCAIGIALGADGVEGADDLIRNAQFAVKRAKASRRVEIYQSGVFDAERERFSLETDLRRAIDGGALELRYQPIIDMSSGRIVSFEALTRWPAGSENERLPDEFIPVAEESGLIVPLGRWAIAEAGRQLAEWRARGAGGDVGVAINVSPIQISQDDVVGAVAGMLAATGLKGEAITLELTESAILNDPARISTVLRRLKDLGVQLAMDDFGTGYSSLAYLQQLPIDILKIDRSFVTAMLADRDKLSIVRAILSLAQAMGKRTTAEGIETRELEQTLAALGCSLGQGYLFARPLDAEAAYRALCARNH